MFTKIAKGLLKGDASLNLIVTREDDALLRVIAVVRDPKGGGDLKDSALQRGVTILDTPERLDETLGQQLADYQAAREEARGSIAEVTEALKEEAAANRKKAKQTRGKTGVGETATAKAARTGAEPGQLTLSEAATPTSAAAPQTTAKS